MQAKKIPLRKNEHELDWELITLFRKNFVTLWDNLKDLHLGFLSINIHKNLDGKYDGNSTLPNVYRLKGFYADYRIFYLQNERTNIFKFMKYLSSLTDNIEYHEFIKKEKKEFRSKTVENDWLKIDGKKLDTAEILDLWFNAEIFHNDKAKILRLNRVRNSMSESLWKTLVFMCVYDTSLKIRNINWSQSELSSSNLYLLLPATKKVRLKNE